MPANNVVLVFRNTEPAQDRVDAAGHETRLLAGLAAWFQRPRGVGDPQRVA